MQQPLLPRREFLVGTAATAGAALWASSRARLMAAGSKDLHIATNSYSWSVFYGREGKDFGASLDAGLQDVAASGLNGYEPGIGGPGEIAALAPLLKKHGLEMRSIYVNSTLHSDADAEKSIANILDIGRAARAVGTKIIVTNPNPIQWGGTQYKDDGQLQTQAAALDRLGKELGKLGLTLAYHNHDIELKQSAREFHHMMAGTDPRYVSLCLDAHWVYRGTGNSQVALFDVVKLYGKRVTELHLRQSEKGTWSETLGQGDIDYARLASELRRLSVSPHLVMEIAVENGTPKTLSPVEAHRRSAEFARTIFGPKK